MSLGDYDDDNFYEPSEADLIIDQFKEELRKSVKAEYKAEMERLRAENEKLQDIKKNWADYELRIEMTRLELERKSKRAKIEAEQARIKKVLGHLQTTYYEVHGTKWVYIPKCDKCNEDREVVFYSPSGRKLSEPCKCSRFYHKADVIELPCLRFSFYDSQDGLNNMILKLDHPENEDGYVSVYIYELADDKPYEEINKWKAIFANKEKAEAYAAWLTEKNRKELEEELRQEAEAEKKETE